MSVNRECRFEDTSTNLALDIATSEPEPMAIPASANFRNRGMNKMSIRGALSVSLIRVIVRPSYPYSLIPQESSIEACNYKRFSFSSIKTTPVLPSSVT